VTHQIGLDRLEWLHAIDFLFFIDYVLDDTNIMAETAWRVDTSVIFVNDKVVRRRFRFIHSVVLYYVLPEPMVKGKKNKELEQTHKQSGDASLIPNFLIQYDK
ncbi:hypothetical protein ACJX0J_026467, partial [Zea mays]